MLIDFTDGEKVPKDIFEMSTLLSLRRYIKPINVVCSNGFDSFFIEKKLAQHSIYCEDHVRDQSVLRVTPSHALIPPNQNGAKAKDG